MKRMLALFVSMVLLSVVALAQSVVMSNNYEAPAFFAVYPAQETNPVTYQSQTVTDKEGAQLPLNLYSESLASSWFGISYVDYPTPRNSDALNDVLDAAASTLDTPARGAKTDAFLSGLPAREMSSTDKAGDVVYERVALSQNRLRLWQSIVVCVPPVTCTRLDADRFFDSVRIK